VCVFEENKNVHIYIEAIKTSKLSIFAWQRDIDTYTPGAYES
jgi:hypothetical protein